MSEQRHIIKRQIIELTVQDPAAASKLQDEVSRIYRQRIVPLIDRYCMELGQPDRVYRIESLELDLGVLDTDHFEEQFVAKTNTALRQTLAAQIGSQEQDSPKNQSALELFAFFVRTGSLPWWADDSQPNLLDENLQQLLDETPQELRRLLQPLAQDEQLRGRMISQYSDEQLQQLAGLLVPAYEQYFRQDIKALKNLLQKTKTGVAWPPSRLRRSLWDTFLEMAAFGGQYPTLAAFYWAALERIAAKLGKTGSALRAEIGSVLQDGQAGGSRPLKELLKTLADAHSGMTTPIGELLRLLAQHQLDSEGPLAEVWAGLRSLAPRLSDALRMQWLSAVHRLGKRPSPQRVLQLLQSELVAQSPEELSGLARLLQAASDAKDVGQELAARLQNSPFEDGLGNAKLLKTLRFSEAEELSVANAGLVILWPFLASFFTHLGLVEEKQFKDPAARQRGVGLLQFIATRDAAPPEYLLPLNKLLCGMELKQVFDFGPPLLKSEKKECANLLKAVIAQAPILRDMSADAFRGSFLLRPGLLSLRDGSWLLRVERKSYDVVLERFPWNWEWVRLPWMESALRVEW